jgi:hypothetical protein
MVGMMHSFPVEVNNYLVLVLATTQTTDGGIEGADDQGIANNVKRGPQQRFRDLLFQLPSSMPIEASGDAKRATGQRGRQPKIGQTDSMQAQLNSRELARAAFRRAFEPTTLRLTAEPVVVGLGPLISEISVRPLFVIIGSYSLAPEHGH